jgi:hypothetical protein
MRYFISLMCTHNAQPVTTLLLLCFYSLNSYEFIWKNLLFRSHPRGPVYAAAVSLVLIGHIGTTCRPKPYSSPPPPYLSPTPIRDNKRAGGGKGRSRCRPSPASYAPTAFSHGSDPPYMPADPVISDGPPFYRENAPVGALGPEMTPPLEQRSFGDGGGGGLPRRGAGLDGGGGGAGRENACVAWNTSSLGKNSQGRYIWSHPHFFPGWLHSPIHLWSVALSRIDSRWKKSAYMRGTGCLYRVYTF